MAEPGTPLIMLKKLGSGAKHYARSGNLKHTIFYFGPNLLTLASSQGSYESVHLLILAKSLLSSYKAAKGFT